MESYDKTYNLRLSEVGTLKRGEKEIDSLYGMPVLRAHDKKLEYLKTGTDWRKPIEQTKIRLVAIR